MSEGELFIEKRRHKRVEKKYKVNYKILSPDDDTINEIPKGFIKKTGNVSDISIGGIKIIGNDELREGDILKIEIFPEERNSPVKTFAEVKWVSKLDDKYIAGIEFLILSDEDKEFINNLVVET